MDKLQAGIEPALAVLPQPPVLLQPGKAALDNPALRHDLEGVQLTAICDLRFAICDLRFAICDLRFAICDLRFAL